jgi:hypothetical protein
MTLPKDPTKHAEYIEKQKKSHLGKKAWNDGIPMSDEQKEKQRLIVLSKRVINTDLSNGSKICSICKIEKPLSEFFKAPTCNDGLQLHCKFCDYEKKYNSKKLKEIDLEQWKLDKKKNYQKFGKDNPFYNKTHTPEVLKINIEYHTGIKDSEETLVKKRDSHIGLTHTQETKDAQSKNRVGMRGTIPCEGLTELNKLIRTNTRMYVWRDEVFKRDNYKDVFNGKNSDDLMAHHIIKLSDIIEKYNITTISEAISCDLIWDVNNGITLCKENHMNGFHYENDGNELIVSNLPFNHNF